MHLRRSPWLFMLALLAAAILFASCGGDDGDSGDGGDGGGGGGAASADQSVSVVDNSYDPNELTVPAGEEITVTVTNDGENPHTFTIDDLEVDTGTLDPGDSTEVTFEAPDSEVTFYCEVHGESVMSGTVVPEG